MEERRKKVGRAGNGGEEERGSRVGEKGERME